MVFTAGIFVFFTDHCFRGPMQRVFLSLVLLLVGLSPAQESVQEIRRQIKAVEKEATQEKDLSAAEKKRHQDFVDNARKKLAAFDEQSSVLKAQIDSLKAESVRLDEARKQASGSSHWVEARKLKYQENLLQALDSLVPVLNSDIPFKNQEAVDAIHETASQLRKGIVTPEEALGRAFDILMERMQLGYTTENWSGYFAWQGRSLSGKFVRYGAIAAIFVSQDGQEVFWLQKKGSAYNWQSVGDNAVLKGILKETLKVAEGQAPPMLVMLPFVTKPSVTKSTVKEAK